MNHLYNIFIKLIDKLILPILGLFNPKIKRFRTNRLSLIEKIKNEVSDKNNIIWFHVASLGEYEIAVPLIRLIKEKYKSKIVLTFFSESGFKLKNRIKEIDYTYYLPLDTKSNAKKFLDIINPEIVIFVRSEIWPNYLNEIKKRNIKSYLVESRFNQNSRYLRGIQSVFYLRKLKIFNKIFSVDEESKKALNRVKINNVIVSGSLKVERVKDYLEQNYNNNIIKSFKGDDLCIVCGSTWKEDEKIIFKYIKESKKEKIKWIIAPHDISKKNIERLQSILSSNYSIYSDISNNNVHGNILILNTIGDLKSVYRYSDISYIGGGMGSSGLHNILEACIYNKPVIIGKNYSGFIEAEQLVESGGVASVKDYNEFKLEIEKLIYDKKNIMDKANIISNYIKTKTGALSVIQKQL